MRSIFLHIVALAALANFSVSSSFSSISETFVSEILENLKGIVVVRLTSDALSANASF